MNDLKIKTAIKLLDKAIQLLDIAYADHCAMVERLEQDNEHAQHGQEGQGNA